MNLYNGESKGLMFESAGNLHHSSQSFFERGDVECTCVGNLVGSLGKPLCSPLGEAELVAAVYELEADP